MYEGDIVKNPYTTSSLINNWLDDEEVNYVEDPTYEGIDYVHNFEK